MQPSFYAPRSQGGLVFADPLPTSDPLLAGHVWSNNGVLTISSRVLYAPTRWGVNISGLENNPNPITPSNSSLQYFWTKGFKMLRLCIDWRQAQTALNTALDPTYMALVDGVVTYATGLGFEVAIDLHNYGGYGNAGQVGSTAVPNSAFADVWTRLATRYNSNQRVIYDLMNEPAVDWVTWTAACNAAIAAIRAVEGSGYHHMVFIPLIYSNTHNNETQNVLTFMRSITDSAGKSRHAIEFHYYDDADGSGTSGTVSGPTVGVENLPFLFATARLAGEQLFYGEFADGNNTLALQCLDNKLAYLQEQSDVLYGAAWWGGGDFGSVLDNGYYFGINPSSQGVDTPFVQHFQKFMPGGSMFNAANTISAKNGYAGSAPVFGAGGAYGRNGLIVGANSFFAVSTQFPGVLTPATSNLNASYEFKFKMNGAGGGFRPLRVIDYITVLVDGNGYIQLYETGANAYVPINICDGVERHIRVVGLDSGYYLYLDGALIQSGTAHTTIDGNRGQNNQAGGGDLFVGCEGANAAVATGAIISNVAVWGTDRRSAPVPTGPYTGGEPGLIGYWPLVSDANAVNVSPVR